MRRRHLNHLRGNRRFLPTVERFLETGFVDLVAGDNPFVTVSLIGRAAQDLRAAWLAGDHQAMAEALSRIPGNLFA